MRAGGQSAAPTGVRGGLRRGLAVVLAVAALTSWFWQLGPRAVGPSGDTVRTVAGRLAEDATAFQPAGNERLTGPSGQAYHARAIETIRTGQRVLARNPQLADEDLPDSPVDPASWVNIHLRMAKPTGDHLEITLLRPVEWLAEHLAQTAVIDAEYSRALDVARGVGADHAMTEIRSVIVSDEEPPPALCRIHALDAHQTPTPPWVFLTLHELEAVGPAELVQVEPCPPIGPGAGRLVTGTFAHQSGEVFDITVDGLTAPIGCTGAHPFWSEDRQDFIPARALIPGETLRTESGTLRQITRITPRRGPPIPVFNLEVDIEHVYYVSVDGVLVHNAYSTNSQYSTAPLYEVDLAYNLRKNSAHGLPTNTVAEHVPQSKWGRELIPGHTVVNNMGREPAIRVTRAEAESITRAETLTRVPASAREALAIKIRILREYTNAPNSALRELIDLNRKLHPTDYLPLHRP